MYPVPGKQSRAPAQPVLINDPVLGEAEFARIDAPGRLVLHQIFYQGMLRKASAIGPGRRVRGHPDVTPTRPLDRDSGHLPCGPLACERVKERVCPSIVNLPGGGAVSALTDDMSRKSSGGSSARTDSSTNVPLTLGASTREAAAAFLLSMTAASSKTPAA